MMHCDLDEETDSVADTLHGLIERIGWKAAQHRFGLKIFVGRATSLAELQAAVREFDLAFLALSVR
jgi:hypothetical protein